MAKPEIFRRAARLRAQARAERPWTEKLGTVTAYTLGAATCTVLFDGEDPTEDPDDAVLFKRPYIPNIDDRVHVRKVQGRRVIEGVVGVLPALRVYRSAALSVPANGVTTLIPWDAESWNSRGSAMHDNSTNPSRLIAPVTGIYDFKGAIHYDGNAAGNRLFMLRKNAAGAAAGGTVLIDHTIPAGNQAEDLAHLAADDLKLTAGDYVEVFARQTSPNSNGLIVGPERTFATLRLATA